MNGAVLIKTYSEPQFNVREILRYSGCREADDEVLRIIDECIKECRKKLIYRVCYCELPVTQANGTTDLTFAETNSKALGKNLAGCRSIVLFAATIGIEIDRLIAKYGRISPTKALMFQSIGAERIESLCDLFNEDINNSYAAENLYTRPRFSPGYGDFPLEVQKDIFRVLDCPRKIGISLNDSLLMSPSKSVTAIIGISDKCASKSGSSCTRCKKTDCKFRRTDK